MREILRPGAIGLVIGLILMAVAPTNAGAITPISIFDFETFPDNSSGPALNGKGVVLSVNSNDTSDISILPFDKGFSQVSSQLGLPSFGLIIVSQESGFNVLPFSLQNDNGIPSSGSSGDMTTDGPGNSDDLPQSNESVSAAPEPATWIMMILGFWIAAWRLRRVREDGMEPISA